ncbi:hypothetical protein [Cesiribacter andamanensis]|uniref:Lipoprotein n=1 Tax=Cesiribacter andamanensis AMV16 TaxID=1279009 RepID=M7MWB8_9BACT|nr:hypothetical protein [Cesiribacter andamanensis]EMR00728.1 hypothetical protein ADICEAN_04147 [Cesiribacter andamanensis AMV16]
MKGIRGLFLLLTLLAVFSACQERMICPAYQSTFIFDEEVRYQLFTKFEADSMPKQYAGVDKNLFGLIKKQPRKKKERQMAIVAMRNILPLLSPIA